MWVVEKQRGKKHEGKTPVRSDSDGGKVVRNCVSVFDSVLHMCVAVWNRISILLMD